MIRGWKIDFEANANAANLLLQNMQKSMGRQKWMNILLQKPCLCQQSQWQFPLSFCIPAFNVKHADPYLFGLRGLLVDTQTKCKIQIGGKKVKVSPRFCGGSVQELRALLVAVRSLATDQHQILTLQNFAFPLSDSIRPPRLERQFSMKSTKMISISIP